MVEYEYQSIFQDQFFNRFNVCAVYNCTLKNLSRMLYELNNGAVATVTWIQPQNPRAEFDLINVEARLLFCRRVALANDLLIRALKRRINIPHTRVWIPNLSVKFPGCIIREKCRPSYIMSALLAKAKRFSRHFLLRWTCTYTREKANLAKTRKRFRGFVISFFCHNELRPLNVDGRTEKCHPRWESAEIP